ncbi:hypothetical protein EXE55_09520 [Burkholderia glumae]|uniref:hypothetical protein n=1 Tax=Burkholderia glumae TaxID=337 RepID=UPI00137463FB|nr:hypothetical protein [Burkholderia glumae]MCR1767579.1 hypothetical protein [Burkholderia glumae]QHP91149.1 hypothetical protein EXE55_09520 [Burkholderia glumae]
MVRTDERDGASGASDASDASDAFDAFDAFDVPRERVVSAPVSALVACGVGAPTAGCCVPCDEGLGDDGPVSADDAPLVTLGDMARLTE